MIQNPDDHDHHNLSLDDRINIRGALESIRATLTEREKALNERFTSQESNAEFKRISLKEALDEAKTTTERALTEAKANVEDRLLEAKVAADERGLVLQSRIEKLESGGAPFASRLDEGMTKLAGDVEKLNNNAVRAEVIEALRERQQEDVKTQRRQIRNLSYSTAAAIVVSLASIMFRLAFGN
ncbi:MAG: hypothetical protein ABIQ41_09010 [Gemmatimonadales bacterium]